MLIYFLIIFSHGFKPNVLGQRVLYAYLPNIFKTSKCLNVAMTNRTIDDMH